MQGPERIDYAETSDVTDVHASIRREHSDPRADVTPIPVWLAVVCGIAICWAGAYLGVFHGGFSSNIYNEYESNPGILFPLPQRGGKGVETPVTQSLAAQGKSVFGQFCVTCHMPNGAGQPGAIPPLAGSEWVVGSEKRLVAIVLKGLAGPVTVAGKQYNSQMPGWETQIPAKKLAAVLSFTRAQWGNSTREISEAQVEAAKKEFAGRTAQFTEPELLQIPEDAILPGGGAAPAPAPAAPQPAAATASAKPASSAPATAPLASAAIAPADPRILAEGKRNYMMICVACHQPNGLGLPPVFPPLAKTEYVNGSAERFAAMILKGNGGPMTIDGKVYNTLMPGQEALLSDEKIASIMTYVRASFGNNAPPVGPEIVAAARKKHAGRTAFWTEAELKAYDAAPPGAAAAPAGSAPPAPAAPAPSIPSPGAPGGAAAAPSPAIPSVTPPPLPAPAVPLPSANPSPAPQPVPNP